MKNFHVSSREKIYNWILLNTYYIIVWNGFQSEIVQLYPTFLLCLSRENEIIPIGIPITNGSKNMSKRVNLNIRCLLHKLETRLRLLSHQFSSFNIPAHSYVRINVFRVPSFSIIFEWYISNLTVFVRFNFRG